MNGMNLLQRTGNLQAYERIKTNVNDRIIAAQQRSSRPAALVRLKRFRVPPAGWYY